MVKISQRNKQGYRNSHQQRKECSILTFKQFIYIVSLLLIDLPVGIAKDVWILWYFSRLIVSKLFLTRYVLEEVAHFGDRTLRLIRAVGANLFFLSPNLEPFSTRYELITLLLPLFPIGRPYVIREEGDIQVANYTHPSSKS